MRITTGRGAYDGALQDTGSSPGEEAQVVWKGGINTNRADRVGNKDLNPHVEGPAQGAGVHAGRRHWMGRRH